MTIQSSTHANSESRMSSKKNGNGGTRKSPTSAVELKPAKPAKLETDAQNPSKQEHTEPEHTEPETNCASEKNFHNTDHSTAWTETHLQKVQDLLCESLKELQIIYNDACKAKANKITIELSSFASIDNKIQKA